MNGDQERHLYEAHDSVFSRNKFKQKNFKKYQSVFILTHKILTQMKPRVHTNVPTDLTWFYN